MLWLYMLDAGMQMAVCWAFCVVLSIALCCGWFLPAAHVAVCVVLSITLCCGWFFPAAHVEAAVCKYPWCIAGRARIGALRL